MEREKKNNLDDLMTGDYKDGSASGNGLDKEREDAALESWPD